MSYYRFIAADVEARRHTVATLCRVLRVSRSGYSAWRARDESVQARADGALARTIAIGHAASRGTYGSPRVARLMRHGLHGCRARRHRVRTTVSDPPRVPAPDRVERAFAPAAIGAPDRLWVADISSVATDEGWLYLAVVLDAFSRKVVGWAMADHLRATLVVDALAMAVARGQPPAGLVHHSDRGARYTSLAFSQRLAAARIVPSMGSVGDCFDNAVAESFFATLKVEVLHRQHWPTRHQAQLAIFEFIEVW